jgi:hypothetical protein
MRRFSTGTGRPRSAATSASLLTVASLLLGAMVLTVPAPERAQAQTQTAKAARELPGLPSPAVTRRGPEVPVNGTDPSDIPPHPSQLADRVPPPRASAFDPARSKPVDAETTPTRRVWVNSDGTKTAEFATRPKWFKDPAGVWRDIDLSVVTRADGRMGAKAAGASSGTLGPTAKGAVAQVETSAGTVVLRHPDAAGAAGRATAAGATYSKALPGERDLLLTPTPDGFEESVILADADASPSYLDEFVLPAGATARQGASGVEFLDAAGNVFARFGEGLAFDASFPAGGPVGTTPVSVTLLGGAASNATENAVTVRVAIDPAWLAAPERKFPVTIDPPFSAQTLASVGGRDTFVVSGQPNSSFGTSPHLYVGFGSGGLTRSYLYFDVAGIVSPNHWVTSATVDAYNFWSPDCTSKQINLSGLASTFSDATTYANKPSPDAAGVVSSATFAYGANGCPYNKAYFDATTLARRWVGEGATNFGLQLAAANEGDAGAGRLFFSAEAYGANAAPTLAITYDRYPTDSVPTSPVNGAVLPNTSPELVASIASDIDIETVTASPGEAIRYWFRVTTSPDAETGTHVADSNWVVPAAGQAPRYTIPAGALLEGVTYYWHVWTWDGIAPWRPPAGTPYSFRVDLGSGQRGSQPHDAAGPVQSTW